MNVHAIRAIYRFEMARTRRTLMQSIISPVISTSLYFVVFGAAIGSRIQQVGGISYGAFIVPGLIMLSLLTQSISNASFGIYFPRVHRDHLRAAVGAGVLPRDRGQLRRRGGDQVDHPGPDHPRHRGLVRAAAGRAPGLDAGVPRADGGDVQPGRLHHRHLGRRLREAAARAAADRHAADLPRRQLLLDRHAAAVLAEGHAVQSGGLPDQRLPLELLRHRRRRASA